MSELFGPVENTDHQLPTPPPLPLSPPEKKITAQLRHHKITEGSTAMKAFTFPLAIGAEGTRILSNLAKEHAFAPVSGLGWAATGTINGLFKALSWATAVSKNGELQQALPPTAQEIHTDLINTRNRTPLLTNSVEIAAQIAAQEAKAANDISWWGKQYLNCVYTFLSNSSPNILRAMHSVISSAEETTDWLKNVCYQGMHSDKLSEELLNLADRTDAMRWKLIYSHEEDIHGPLIEQVLERHSFLPQTLTVAAFKNL
ncbi:MAG: hypothetical protein JSR46_07240, partial [Verrucomicrobia bacterium]|nr:hypothetical protein [Verrucomicrobiota bacterium]